MYPSTLRAANIALLFLLPHAALTHAAGIQERQLPPECTVVDAHTSCPPGVVPPGDCHTHNPGEWHCEPTATENDPEITTTPTLCSSVTTITGIDLTVTDYFNDFYPKLETAWSGITHSSELVNVFTVTAGDDLGYAYVPREVLEKAGFTDFYTTTGYVNFKCPTTTTGSEELPPSPTGSDCVAHGDHWDCKPLETGTDDDDDHDHSATTDKLPPSPTGKDCVAHGDHWDCEPNAHATTTGTGDDDDEHDHDATTGSGELPPSPTGSACVAHGDHWDCEPIVTPTTSRCGSGNVTSECSVTTMTPAEETGAASSRFGGVSGMGNAIFGTICVMFSVFLAGLVVV